MFGLVSYNSDEEEEQQQEQQQEQAQVPQSLHTKIVGATKDGVKNGRSLLEVNISLFLVVRHQ